MNSAPPRFIYSLVTSVSCVGLLFVWSSSGWPQEAKKVGRVKELQLQRVIVLEELRDGATSLFKHARISYDSVLLAERELLMARLAVAENQQNRIKACDQTIKDAETFIQLANTIRDAARGTTIPVLAAKGFLLEAQIEREKAATGG